MPFAIRAMLHERVGGYIERTEADAIELQLDLLAHHYWNSENLAKKREYLVPRRGCRRDDATRTPPRSTISSGWRRSSARASASTCS